MNKDVLETLNNGLNEVFKLDTKNTLTEMKADQEHKDLAVKALKDTGATKKQMQDHYKKYKDADFSDMRWVFDIYYFYIHKPLNKEFPSAKLNDTQRGTLTSWAIKEVFGMNVKPKK